MRRYFATKEEAALCYSRLRASCVGKEALEAEATAGNRLLLLAGVLNRGDVNMTAEEAMAVAEALAVAAARAGARVLCLEGGSKPLRKVRVSGGGRCNVMHDATTWEARVGSGRDLLSERYPRGADQLLGAPARSECPLS